MHKITAYFSTPGKSADPAVLEESFRNHYRDFRALLTANNSALDLMAAMELALTRGRPFGMAFVRGQCTAMTVNVYKMIHNLQQISDGRYQDLNPAFEKISARIEEILARQPEVAPGEYILPLSQISKEDADAVGEKLANLGEVHNRAGLVIPAGFAITASATQYFMHSTGLQDEINRLLKTVDLDDIEALYTTSARIQRLISAAPLPEDLERQIMESYRSLPEKDGAGPLISMRSSATEEDGSGASFAGQYRTQLNISEDSILETFKEIVASKYGSQAIIYRHQRGFRHQDVIMCVGCMVMVDAAVSGVMFSRSPRDTSSSLVEINAAPGLGRRVVEGTADTDYFQVYREDPTEVCHRGPGNVSTYLTPEKQRELAGIAISLEQHFGVPQDIEWSIEDGGRVIILQSRPLAQLAQGDSLLINDSDIRGKDLLMRGGLSVSRGTAFGPVFRVRGNLDLLEFPKGAVLLVEHPMPEWASLMNRAAAVISETGHAATHLAIVAREFGVPAIFGLEHALEHLDNGTEVTVDADSRRVYRGKREEILSRAVPPPNLMVGSPIYHILEEIMALVSPLNLTDPSSPFFRPSQCETLHDLTRFCHEKAVDQMFTFGKMSGFDAKAAKQLVGESPFQWWVLDLDDGFREGFDVKNKYVSWDDIVSEPMKAIWDGMTVKPWLGPPPVSMKGFGSILFRSTMNPSLDPAVRASLGNRNFFLISRNFCNLSMRLGYHFTLAEAYLGELLTENYVSFQFKGGAADRSRRFTRVYLLREILERYGFRVEVKLDALTARIEKKPKEYLIERLKVLGYLLIHTRQIDMVMGEQSMVDRYRNSIIGDLDEIAEPEPNGGG
ncbi:MAG: pyruvate, water dikinase [Actinobacteria bacterium]|nr:pyruvate, water dikinase [Actinomycetota bacterium]